MIIIKSSTLADISRHVQISYPEEGCGLLLGMSIGDVAHRIVKEAFLATNINIARLCDRYEIKPSDYLSATRRSQLIGCDIVSIYHSHPDHPACPSETDRLRAVDLWGEAKSWSYVILEVSGGSVASIRSWVLERGQFSEEPIQVVATLPC